MAREAPYRQGDLNDVTETMLSGLAQHEDVDRMIAFLSKMKEARSGVRASVASAVRPAEGMELVAQTYETAIRGYERFGVSVKDMPRLAKIMAKLSPENIALIEKLPNVRVCLPGGRRYELVAAIDKKVGHHGIKLKTFAYELGDDKLWSNGQAEKVNKRQVVFVDGGEVVPYNESLQAGKTNQKQVVALIADYKKRGFDVLAGAQDFLGLQIQVLAEGKLIDKNNWIVLNADVVAKDEKALLGCGFWSDDEVNLNGASPCGLSNVLRLRAAVRVNL